MNLEIIKNLIINLNENLSFILALLITIASIIEKSKAISIKPITCFFKWIGKIANTEVFNKIDSINDKINNLDIQVSDLGKKVDVNERDRIRYEILSFANGLRDGKKPTKDAFQHIRLLYYKYHESLNGNGLISEEYEYIKCSYSCLHNNPMK